MFTDELYNKILEASCKKEAKENMAAVMSLAAHKLSLGHDGLILSYEAQQTVYDSMSMSRMKIYRALVKLTELGILIKINDAVWRRSYALYEVREDYINQNELKESRLAARKQLCKETLDDCETVKDAWHWLRRSTGNDLDKTMELNGAIVAKVLGKGYARLTINRWKEAYVELYGPPVVN